MAEKQAQPRAVLIRSWPKMIFMYPTAVVALCMGIASSTAPDDWQRVWGASFLIVFGLNMMVLTFEFPRATSLTVAIGVIAGGLGLVLLNMKVNIIAPLADWTRDRSISASPEFYYFVFALFIVLFVAMYVVTRFDYWELSANELVHHHGLLGDVERFSTAGLKLNKEISDVFEYMLVRAGRVIMLIPGHPRPVILENVINISRIERESDRMLDARVVRIESTGGPITAEPPQGTLQEAEG